MLFCFLFFLSLSFFKIFLPTAGSQNLISFLELPSPYLPVFKDAHIMLTCSQSLERLLKPPCERRGRILFKGGLFKAF